MFLNDLFDRFSVVDIDVRCLLLFFLHFDDNEAINPKEIKIGMRVNIFFQLNREGIFDNDNACVLNDHL